MSAVDRFLGELTRSLGDNTFVRLVLSTPVAAAGAPEKVIGRLVDLKTGPHLSLTLRYPTRDETRNAALAEAAAWVRDAVATRFRSALLQTVRRDWQLRVTAAGAARLATHKPACTAAPSRAHDHPRQVVLDGSARDWLAGLGVADAAGKVRASMAAKYSQINRYLEIFTHLATDCGWAGPAAPGDGPGGAVTIADMGCGKGYLSFGVWHLFQRVWHRPVRVIGVEARKEMAVAANQLACRIDATGLAFTPGTIDSVPLPKLDALIALHACNTATDDAIRRGIELGARLIVVAPCCHQELRPQLGKPEPLAPVLGHGIMAERMAEWVTDGLRALVLAWAGYRPKVFEFVATEHTPKNLMIAAIRTAEPFQDQQARQRAERFKEFFGVRSHALDPVLRG